MISEIIFASIFVIASATIAASLASFIGVLSERPQRGESIMGRSHCACGRKLKIYENIPVVGWVRVGGRTTCCKSRIPVRYVITETIAAVPGGIVGYLIFDVLRNPFGVDARLPLLVAMVGVVAFTLMISLVVMHHLAKRTNNL